MIKQQLKRNGPNLVVITRTVDSSKPKCWVEDNLYTFNTELVSIVPPAQEVLGMVTLGDSIIFAPVL